MYAIVANVVAPARISARIDESGISLGYIVVSKGQRQMRAKGRIIYMTAPLELEDATEA